MLTLEVIILSFVIVLIGGYCYFINKYKNPSGATKTDKLIMLGFSLAFFLFSLIGLGSTTNFPEPWQPSTINEQLSINLTTATKLSSLYYYSGINNGQYHWSYDDAQGVEHPLNDNTPNGGFPAHFRWNKLTLPQDTPIKQLKLTFDKPILQINQLALFDSNNNYLTNLTVNAGFEDLNRLISPNPPRYYDDTKLSSTMFDEIYYATTAYQYLNGLSPYVAVHPPLGMLFISLGIALFGMSAFAWRIVALLFATALIPLIYLFALRLFKNRNAACASSVLLMAECMHYTLGRLAFLDGIVTFFIIAEYYFLFQYLQIRQTTANFKATSWPLFLAATSLGLGIACKWSALYSTIPILICLIYGELILHKPRLNDLIKRIIQLAIIFIALPSAIYCLSYVPYAQIDKTNELFSFIWRLQKYMYDFQAYSLANTTHPYASSWYKWPLLVTPMSIYFWASTNINDLATSVVFIGNPLIYWLIPPCVLGLIYLITRNYRNYAAWFLFLAFLAQYLPYAFIHHILFIYYFYSAVPLILLALVLVSHELLNFNYPLSRYFVYLYLVLTVIVFFIFLPATGGFEYARSYVVHYLLWFSQWNF